MYHATRKTVEEDVVRPVEAAMKLVAQALRMLDAHPKGIEVVKIKAPKYFVPHLQAFAGSLLAAAAKAPSANGRDAKEA